MTQPIAEVTNNQHGFTYHLSPFGKAFVSYAKESKFPVVDIGCAFGVASIPALESGAEVISIDVESTHLQKLVENAPAHLHNRLTTMQARFPNVEFPDETIGAVYMSQVLPFLTGEEIEAGFKKIYNWLVPGGKIFVVSFTPYIDHVSSYIPVYETKKSNNIPWAGYIQDLSKYSHDPNISRNLPNQINHIDKEDLERVCSKANFNIERIEYFGDPDNTLPVGIKFDDRERVGLIAVK
jgi:SAM-dependent methyltransferase